MKKMKLNICLLHISHHYGVLAFCRLLNIALLHSQRKLYSTSSALLLTQAIAEGDGGRCFLCCLNLRTALKMTPAWLK